MIVTIPEYLMERILYFCSQNNGGWFGTFIGRYIIEEDESEYDHVCQIWDSSPPISTKTRKICEEGLFEKVGYSLKKTISPINDEERSFEIKPPIRQKQTLGYWIKHPKYVNDPKNCIKLIEIEKLRQPLEDIWPYRSISPFDNFNSVIGIISNKKKPILNLYTHEFKHQTENVAINIPFKPIQPEIIKFKTDIFSRIQGILDTDYLVNKTVVIVGLGTGGSVGAIELAKCGICNFKLIDFDRLETHNISRHICGLDDVGRLKTNAVKDFILRKNPMAIVKTYEFDILKNEERFRNIIHGADLIFVATDNELSKLMINRICLEEKIPSIYGAAYERAFGGDIIRVIPDETPCYDCVMGKLIRTLDFSQQRNGVIDYTNISDPNQLKAEPGLSIDVGFIALIQSKFALLTLLRGSESDLKDLSYNMCFWGNKDEWIFSEPFQCRFAETELRDDCETCRVEEYYERELGKSKDELKKMADKIVEEASKRKIDKNLLKLLKMEKS